MRRRFDFEGPSGPAKCLPITAWRGSLRMRQHFRANESGSEPTPPLHDVIIALTIPLVAPEPRLRPGLLFGQRKAATSFKGARLKVFHGLMPTDTTAQIRCFCSAP
jgi:hypothetical protein